MPKSKVKFPARRTISEYTTTPGKRGPKRKAKCDTALLHLPDYGLPERWQHGTRYYVQPEEGSSRLAARVIEECVLDALHLQGALTDTEHEAGMKLRRSFLRARVARLVTARYNPLARCASQNSFDFDRSDHEQAAYRDWRSAMMQIGIHDMDMMMRLCCYDEKLPLHAMAAVHRGLEKLILYYRL